MIKRYTTKSLILSGFTVGALFAMEKEIDANNPHPSILAKQLYALGSLAKDDQKIYLVAMDFRMEATTQENNEERIFMKFLLRCASQPGGIALDYPATPEQARLKVKESKLPFAYKGSKLCLIDKISTLIVDSLEGRASKGVTFEYIPADEDEKTIFKMCNVAHLCWNAHSLAGYALQVGISAPLPLVERELARNEQFRRAFLGPRGPFNALIDHVKYNYKHKGVALSVMEFRKGLRKITSRLVDKGIISVQEKDGIVQQIESHLKAYEKEGSNLLDILAGYCRTKKSIAQGVEDFAVNILNTWDFVERAISGTKKSPLNLAVEKHKKIIVFVDISQLESIVRRYKNQGFLSALYSSIDMSEIATEENFLLPKAGFIDGDLEIITLSVGIFLRMRICERLSAHLTRVRHLPNMCELAKFL